MSDESFFDAVWHLMGSNVDELCEILELDPKTPVSVVKARLAAEGLLVTDEQQRLIRLGKAVDGQAVMLRRAATAARNMSSAEWFSWVNKHLDQLADRLDPPTEGAT